MKKHTLRPFLESLHKDKASLIRLNYALGELLDSARGTSQPREVEDVRKGIEAEIRETALRLVYHIDRVANSRIFEKMGGIVRSTQTLLKHIAPQMRPRTTDRFVIMLLHNHLEGLTQRDYARSRERNPEASAAL